MDKMNPARVPQRFAQPLQGCRYVFEPAPRAALRGRARLDDGRSASLTLGYVVPRLSVKKTGTRRTIAHEQHADLVGLSRHHSHVVPTRRRTETE